jgi:hypothetical protein
MEERNRFYTTAVIFGVAFFLFIIGQVIIRAIPPGPVSIIGAIASLISLPTCFIGIISLAFALGKPANKSGSASLTKLVHDIREPGKITIPYMEQRGESDTQSYGLLLIILSFVVAIAAVLLAFVSVLSSLGSGLGFSGGTCDSFCEGSWNSAYYACMTSIGLLLVGLFVTARPWAWFQNVKSVVFVSADEPIADEPVGEEDFSSLTVLELKAKLKERGLTVSGKKADLITRLNTKKEIPQAETYIHNCHNCKQKLNIPVGYEGRIKCPSCDVSTSISTENDN